MFQQSVYGTYSPVQHFGCSLPRSIRWRTTCTERTIEALDSVCSMVQYSIGCSISWRKARRDYRQQYERYELEFLIHTVLRAHSERKRITSVRWSEV